MNVVSISNNPLDLLEPPEIVNTVVESRPIYYKDNNDESAYLHPDPDRKGIHVVGDDSPPIYIAKNSYNFEGAQYSDLYRQLIAICKASNIDSEGVQVKSAMTPNGSRGYITMTFPNYEVDLGHGDTSQFQLNGLSSHDGSWPATFDAGALRGNCLNKQVWGTYLCLFKSRHTKNLNLDHARRKMVEAVSTFKVEAERWHRWKESTISDRQALEIFAKAADCSVVAESRDIPLGDLLAKIKNKSLKYMWNQYIVHEKQVLGDNEWAVYNALTHWSTHAPVGAKTDSNSVLTKKARQQESVRGTLKLLAA